MTIEALNALHHEEAEARLARSHEFWPKLTEQDWFDAFEAHPKMGDINSLRATYASIKAMVIGELARMTKLRLEKLL